MYKVKIYIEVQSKVNKNTKTFYENNSTLKIMKNVIIVG